MFHTNFDNPSEDKNYVYPALVPMSSAAHGGDDVGVFAIGKIYFFLYIILNFKYYIHFIF